MKPATRAMRAAPSPNVLPSSPWASVRRMIPTSRNADTRCTTMLKTRYEKGAQGPRLSIPIE